jgi:hypothetical protein
MDLAGERDDDDDDDDDDGGDTICVCARANDR